MFTWFLRIVTVAIASWVSHAYVVATSGGSLSPASFDTLGHSASSLWLELRHDIERFDWLILSPLAIGFVLVAIFAFGLLRPTGR